MGNEQSQPVSSEPRRSASDSEEEEEEFDLSAIPDTRRSHSSPVRATASPSSRTENSGANAAAMSRKRKKGAKPRANSKKKRRQSRGVDEEEEMESGTDTQHQPGEDGMDGEDEEARLAEESLLRERRRKVREAEPEMFDEYAMSEDSNLQAEDAREGDAGSRPDFDGQNEGAAVPDEEDGAVTDAEDGAKPRGQDDTEVDKQKQADSDESQSESVVRGADGTADTAEAQTEAISGQSLAGDRDSADENEEQAVVEETPVTKPRKRKQRADDSPTSSPKQVTSKRRKKAEIPSTTDLGDYGPVDELIPEVTVVRQSKESVRRQSNMENYTQPLARGSEIRHPVYNPESPAAARTKPIVAVDVPMSSAGPSRRKDHEASPSLRVDQEQSGSPPRSTSGLKRRPKGPLSPIKMRRDDPWEVQNQKNGPLRNGMAKSTARRKFVEAEDASDQDYQTADGESPEVKPSSDTKKRKKKGKEPAQLKSQSTIPSRKRGPNAFRCPICNTTFSTEKSLESHRNDPTAHENLLNCEKCDEQFSTRAALARHQKEKGHGSGNGLQGKTGQFTTDEKNKLDLWRETFCDEHDINHYEFNEMMTASGKMGNQSWPYKFITRDEFRQEYYDVLPERNIRSMRRYRANYSNVDRSREFTEQDDEDILVLVAQLGQKWVDIGDQLTRDPEAIRQRWKNKLQLEVRGTTLKKGVWEEDERQRFDDALKEIRRTTMSEGIKDVDSFNWAAISLKVETRTGPQCANHWRAMHGKNVKGLWVDSGMSQIMKPKTKSKMERRLAGQKSKPRIEDSDDEAAGEDDGAQETADADEDSGREKSEQNATQSESEAAEEEDGADSPVKATPHKRRKPDIRQDRTPANGLSASQAFEQTQANTSEVKKPTKRRRRSNPSQEQPTPGITVQVRPERSPEFGRKLDELLGNTQSEGGPSGSERGSDGEGDTPENEDEDEEQEDSSRDDDEDQNALVDDEAEEAEEASENEETQSTAEDDLDDEMREAPQLPNGRFAAVNGRKLTKAAGAEQDSDADSIVQTFKNAASPSKKRYGGKQRRGKVKASQAEDFRWPEEDSQSEAESETSGLGIENLPR